MKMTEVSLTSIAGSVGSFSGLNWLVLLISGTLTVAPLHTCYPAVRHECGIKLEVHAVKEGYKPEHTIPCTWDIVAITCHCMVVEPVRLCYGTIHKKVA